jgi:hypothetical protein
MDNLLGRNIFMLKNEGPNKYTILSNYDDVFSPVIKKVNMDSCDFGKFMAKITDCGVQDDINDVDMNGEKFLYLPTGYQNQSSITEDTFAKSYPDDYSSMKNTALPAPYIEQPVQTRVEVADEPDHYVVKTRSGVEVEGYVIPKVIDFDMELTGDRIFIGKTLSTMQPVIAGVRVKNSSFRLKSRCTDMKPGLTGTLVYQMNPANALCTIPFTVVSMTVDPCGKTVVTAQDLMGTAFRFEKSSMDMERIANNGGTYLVPRQMFFVPMEGFNEISNSEIDFHVKAASGGHELIHTGYNRFSFKGPSIDKYASQLGMNATNLSPCQAMFLLASFGFGSESLDTITKTAKCGRVKIHNLRIGHEKQASKSLERIAKGLKSNLIKAASYVENSQSVDSLLSLNFINPDNIQKFVSRLPALKATISDLAMLLIASRLGIKELPETSISTALSRLIEVVRGLETLRATQEQAQVG